MTTDVGDFSRGVTALVEQHYRLIYRYAFRLTGSDADAQDVTQQTFLVAQTKLDQLREPLRAAGWLCAIARNTYRKGLRNKNGSATVSLEHVAEPADEDFTDVAVDQRELQTALNDLPEEFRTPLILFYFEEFSYQEIARQMEVPIGTVMSRLARGKHQLRWRLLRPQTAASAKP